jgi:hypothetical protein
MTIKREDRPDSCHIIVSRQRLIGCCMNDYWLEVIFEDEDIAVCEPFLPANFVVRSASKRKYPLRRGKTTANQETLHDYNYSLSQTIRSNGNESEDEEERGWEDDDAMWESFNDSDVRV